MSDQPQNPALNPANKPPAQAARARPPRVPMGVPKRKLETPELPGYYLHWFLDENVDQAIQAWYEFVEQSELVVNQLNVATSASVSGSAGLGSRIRVLAEKSRGGTGQYLNLMKVKNEYREADQKVVGDSNLTQLQGIFRHEKIITDGPQGAGPRGEPSDRANSYVKTALFGRRPPKG